MSQIPRRHFSKDRISHHNKEGLRLVHTYTQYDRELLEPHIVIYIGESTNQAFYFQVETLALSGGWHARGGRSHFFRLRLRSSSKIFESGPGSGNFSNLRIRPLLKLRLQSSIQP